LKVLTPGAGAKRHSGRAPSLPQGSALTPASNPQDGYTPLFLAAEAGDEAVVGVLLEAGADTSIPLEDGGTSLHQAAGMGHAPIVRMLLDAGADKNLQRKVRGRRVCLLAEVVRYKSINQWTGIAWCVPAEVHDQYERLQNDR
jgi:hypothetical protein